MRFGDYDAQYLPLVLAVLAALIIIGLMADLLRHARTRTRERVLVTESRPVVSIAQSRAWERRLTNLHVVDDTWAEVRIVPRRPPSSAGR